MHSKTLINKDEILNNVPVTQRQGRKEKQRKENERRQAEKQITK